MMYPNFSEEKKLWKQGIEVVVGLDEAGRGPLAGPVVAAAVAINPKSKTLSSKQILNSKIQNPKRALDFNDLDLFRISDLGFRISDIKDSKKLSEKQREFLYGKLTTHPDINWGIGIVSETIIDKINILEASKLAMQKAIENLKPNFLLLDGNFTINSTIPQKPIVKGDQKVFSISAASIIAKVTRDNIMQEMHAKYPNYQFNKHKGYGTALHIQQLRNFGPCKIHRKTFYPINALQKKVK